MIQKKNSRNRYICYMNLIGRQLREVDTFLHLGNVITRNGKIQNELNKRIHLVKRLLTPQAGN